MLKNIFITLILLALTSCSTNPVQNSQAPTTTSLPHQIALLLPLQTKAGQSVRDGFLNAYYESLAKTQIQQTITFYDSNTNSNISALYQQAVSEGADFVVGPLMKDQVEALTRTGNFTVPTLELNYTKLGFRSLPANLYQFGLSPLDEAQQLAEKAASAGKSRAIILAPQNPWGERTVKTLSSRWRSLRGSVVEIYYFNPQSNFSQDIPRLLHINTVEDQNKMKKENNKTILQQQRRQDFDVIFLLAQSDSARAIVPLFRYYYVNDIPIYATSSINSGNAAKNQDLKGVIYCDMPWILETNHSDRLFAVGRDAYLISSNLYRLKQSSDFSISGSTGVLTLQSSHQIYRHLQWATINEGTL